MEQFYKQYNLSNSEFGEFIGVGAKTLTKYWNGIPIRQSSKERIEKAIRIVKEHNLVRPKFVGCGANYDHTSKFRELYWNYRRQLENLMKMEP